MYLEYQTHFKVENVKGGALRNRSAVNPKHMHAYVGGLRADRCISIIPLVLSVSH